MKFPFFHSPYKRPDDPCFVFRLLTGQDFVKPSYLEDAIFKINKQENQAFMKLEESLKKDENRKNFCLECITVPRFHATGPSSNLRLDKDPSLYLPIGVFASQRNYQHAELLSEYPPTACLTELELPPSKRSSKTGVSNPP
ncbi:hypothetical protein TNCV_2715591 [Trichonephila clavipes]|nr:hypothetical protein TNCV_2715591 [Trichonephila clavipes]